MRAVVALAMHTGISVDAWLAGDDRDLATALDMYADDIKATNRSR